MTKKALIEAIKNNLAIAVEHYMVGHPEMAKHYACYAKSLYMKLANRFQRCELFGTYLNIAVNNKLNPNCELARVEKVKACERCLWQGCSGNERREK